MARKTFADKYMELYNSVVKELNYQILIKWKESFHSKEKEIIISLDIIIVNLSGFRYLKKIQTDCLIDNEGYNYPFHILPLDKLSLVADYCKALRKK